MKFEDAEANEPDLETDALLCALSRLPTEDLDAFRRERLGAFARLELQRSSARHRRRMGRLLGEVYRRRVEPGLLVAYGAVTLANAGLTVARLVHWLP